MWGRRDFGEIARRSRASLEFRVNVRLRVLGNLRV